MGPLRLDRRLGCLRRHRPARHFQHVRLSRTGACRRSTRDLDAVAAYPPVVVFTGIATVGFMLGFVLLGIAVAKSRAFPRWSGILISVGAPVHLAGFGIAQLGSPQLWFVAILGSMFLGSGLASCGYRMWADPGN